LIFGLRSLVFDCISECCWFKPHGASSTKTKVQSSKIVFRMQKPRAGQQRGALIKLFGTTVESRRAV